MAVVTAIAAAVAIGAAVVANKRASSASKKRGKANDSRKAANELRNKQARRNFLRAFRQAQANTLTAGLAAGIGLESSAVQGRRGSEVSQATTGLEEFNQFDILGKQFAKFEKKAARRDVQSGTFSGISSIAQQFIGA